MLAKKRTGIICMTLALLLVLVSGVLAEGEWEPNSEGDIVNTNTGKVGIGTTNPGGKLHVAGDIISGNSSTGAGTISIFDTGNNQLYTQGVSPNSFLTDLAGTSAVGNWEVRDLNVFFNGGYVGIGTTGPGQTLDIEGNLELNGSLIGGVSSARAYYNLLAARWPKAQTGALVIQTNVPQDDHTMTQTKIRLKRKYSSGSTSCEYLISGYWSTESNGGFSGRGYQADCSDLQRVRFMRNSGSGKVAIVIGETTTAWSHPMVAVPEFLAHYGIASDNYANGWTASIVSDLSGYINSYDVGNSSPIHETTARVGIGTTNPQTKLEVNGTITAKDIKVESGDIEGNLELNGSLIGGVSSARAYYNLLASRWGRSRTGALVIQTNVPQDDHTMTQTKVVLKSKYSSGSTNCEYLISGYWSTETNGGFSGRGYRADCSDIQRIRFMRNSGNGKVAIVIGEATTTWSHPMVTVPEFLAHYGIASDNYADGWTASIANDLSGYINSDDVGNTSPIHETSTRVGIGTTDPQSMLAVNGIITTKEIKVTDAGWSDFVFEDTYELPSLNSVESYIKKNKHLPDIPSAKEVEQQGLEVSEMLAKQMQKIEEMTLYLIQLKKENDHLKAKLESHNKLLSELKELSKRIEASGQKNQDPLKNKSEAKIQKGLRNS